MDYGVETRFSMDVGIGMTLDLRGRCCWPHCKFYLMLLAILFPCCFECFGLVGEIEKLDPTRRNFMLGILESEGYLTALYRCL